MRSIILLTLFLIPLFGFASFPIQTTTTSDTIIESKKETIEEYKNRIDKQLYNKSKGVITTPFKKRKKFIIGINSNVSSNQNYEKNQSYFIGRLIGNNFLIGGNNSSNEDIYLITRIYFQSTPFYITAKRSLNEKRKGNYSKGGVGYEFYLNKSISLNSELLFYSFLKDYDQNTLISITTDSQGWPIFNHGTEHIHESHKGGIIKIGLQIHF
tara:strand:- start:377 stop:1012 length:636 start_codon:yes stop_codon:yes gene_type:complete